MNKPKVGFYWCASCGGCEESVVDLAEDILAVAEAIEIVLWPVAMDFKRSDVEAMEDGEMAVCFINGAIRTSEQVEMAELLRRKAQLIVAFGSCAHLGGIPGLANLFDRKSIFDRAYVESQSTVNPEGTFPQEVTRLNGHTVTLPRFYDTVRTLGQTIPVDYTIPGCPPPVKLFQAAVEAVLSGNLPPKGTVLAPDVALCEECPRKATKPDRLSIKELKRPHLVIADSEVCLLAQGLMCLGPATRSGCGAVCTTGNMPCTGCLGPTTRVADFGAKALSGLASVVEGEDDATIESAMEVLVDPVGTFYRYSLPGSLLHRKVRVPENTDARESELAGGVKP
ncbi:MAG: oxidoreductase [Armatimonadetes bacterium]|nr:oxidoreductase [Armatimonadota bacterium]